jgi:hypothetical protein
MSGPPLRARELRLPGPATLGALVWLLAMACFLLRGAVFGGGTLFARDIHLVWLPQVESFVQAVAGGALPLWDPFRGFGQPLLGDPSAEIAYPFTWLNLILDPATSCSVFVVSHLVLSGLGVRALCLRQGVSQAGALTAAAVWIASGPFFSLASTWHHMAGAAWIPWVILTGEAAFEAGGIKKGMLFGIALAVQIVAGSADMVAMALVSLAILCATWRPLAPERAWLLGLRPLVGGFGLAIAISAVQWLPTLEIASASARSGLAESERTVWSLHPLALPELFLPFSWNRLPLTHEWISEVLEWRAPWLYSFYVGVPALVLAAAALARREHRSLGAALVLAGSVLVALGRHAPAYGLLVTLMPPLKILRFPMKALVITAFAASVLVGHGLDAWRSGALSQRRWAWGVVMPATVLSALSLAAWGLVRFGTDWLGPRMLGRPNSASPWATLLDPTAARLALAAAASLGVLALALARRRNLEATGLALAALAVVSPMAAHASLHPVAPRALFSYRPEVLDVVGKSRVYVYDYSVRTKLSVGAHRLPYEVARLPAGWDREAALGLGLQVYLNPPTAGRWGVFGSYDLDLLGLQPRFLAELNERLRASEQTPLHKRLLQMASVDYVLDLAPESKWPDLVPVASLPGFFYEAIRVLRVPDALPRAYLVRDARVVPSEAALAAIADPAFDPHDTVMLVDGPSQEALTASEPAAGSGSARTLLRSADRTIVEAEARAPAYLVLVDAWDPGWRAYVDGRETPVLRANVAFRAVALEAGNHRVEFVYRPRSAMLGAAASLAGILIAASALSLRS